MLLFRLVGRINSLLGNRIYDLGNPWAMSCYEMITNVSRNEFALPTQAKSSMYQGQQDFSAVKVSDTQYLAIWWYVRADHK